MNIYELKLYLVSLVLAWVGCFLGLLGLGRHFHMGDTLSDVLLAATFPAALVGGFLVMFVVANVMYAIRFAAKRLAQVSGLRRSGKA